MIECRGVAVRAGSFEIRGATLAVPTGMHAVLTGPTASGKTTLLELIAGAIRPTAGQVCIDGVDVTHSAPELRGVGMVPQHGYLFPHLDTRRNIEYGTRDADGSAQLARRFGVAHLMDRAVSALSGGERQLVALCRALGPRPCTLLMDEPFSALDEKRRSLTLREFHDLQTEWHLTVLHVTHDAADAEFATLQFEMSDGVVSPVPGITG